MKKIVSLILACLFVLSLAAQSSTGGIYFKFSSTKHSLPKEEADYWVKSKRDNGFRNLYLCEGKSYRLYVLDASGKDITKSCTISSPDKNIATIEDGLLKGVAPGIVIIRAGYGGARAAKNVDGQCSFVLQVYPKKGFTITKEGSVITTNPPLPVPRQSVMVSYVDGSKDDEGFKGQEVSPKYELEFNPVTQKYILICKKRIPGYSYKIKVTMDEQSQQFEVTDRVFASDLKPGDYVVYNIEKRRYEAFDGGLRDRTSQLNIDVSGFRDRVFGIVAYVTDYGSGSGIYTSDGKMHHAVVMDVTECDRKWEYRTNFEAGDLKLDCSFYDGAKATQELIKYNQNHKDAGQRVKPIYWIETCNKTRGLPLNTSGWFLPSAGEIKYCNIRAVNTSIERLNKAGRKDVCQVRVGSYYWTCTPRINNCKYVLSGKEWKPLQMGIGGTGAVVNWKDFDYAHAWEYIYESGFSEVRISDAKPQKNKYFVRAMFSL